MGLGANCRGAISVANGRFWRERSFPSPVGNDAFWSLAAVTERVRLAGTDDHSPGTDPRFEPVRSRPPGKRSRRVRVVRGCPAKRQHLLPSRLPRDTERSDHLAAIAAGWAQLDPLEYAYVRELASCPAMTTARSSLLASLSSWSAWKASDSARRGGKSTMLSLIARKVVSSRCLLHAGQQVIDGHVSEGRETVSDRIGQ
jgi:hypothetical protein